MVRKLINFSHTPQIFKETFWLWLRKFYLQNSIEKFLCHCLHACAQNAVYIHMIQLSILNYKRCSGIHSKIRLEIYKMRSHSCKILLKRRFWGGVGTFSRHKGFQSDIFLPEPRKLSKISWFLFKKYLLTLKICFIISWTPSGREMIPLPL